MKRLNKSKFKLGLVLPTDPRWVKLAEMDLQFILTDHAYCEQKATTTCISLIQSYPDKKVLVEKVVPIVSEEWSHFAMVLEELNKRSLTLGPQRKDEYVNELLKFKKKGISKEENLLERLIICALIEARSCERFRLLSLHINDQDLKKFYHHFMVSEAGHYKVFLGLAKHYFGNETTKNRWQEYLKQEAIIMSNIDIRGDRIH